MLETGGEELPSRPTVEHMMRPNQEARRINTAAGLLAAGKDIMDATRDLAWHYQLSERQARRCAQRARVDGTIEVPDRR